MIDYLTKTNIKQNFVKEKITVWDFEVNFKLYSIICVEITLIQNRVLFFLYKKVLRKQGCKGMASDALTLKKYINKVKKKYLLIIIFINKITKVFKMDT